MATNPSSTTVRRSSASRQVAVGLDRLMRLLVNKLSSGRHVRPSIDAETGGEQIIVDTEIDGVRYRLVRMPKAPETHVVLSPREQEIVRMVAQGYPNKLIADVLNISSWTVCTHLRHVFAKLGVGSRAAMVARYGALDSLPAVPSRRRD